MTDYQELIERLRSWSKYPHQLANEAADAIQYLTEGAEEVNGAVRRLLEERNAALADLEQYGQCGACGHYPGCGADEHSYCDGGFKWRGVQGRDEA